MILYTSLLGVMGKSPQVLIGRSGLGVGAVSWALTPEIVRPGMKLVEVPCGSKADRRDTAGRWKLRGRQGS